MDNNKEEIRELRETIEHLIARVKYLEKTLINDPDEMAEKLARIEHLIARMLTEPDEMRRLSDEFKNRYGRPDWEKGEFDRSDWQ